MADEHGSARGLLHANSCVLQPSKVYPWRLFRLLDGGLEPAAILADAAAGFQGCVMDTFSQHFVRKYPTDAALASAEAMVELQAVAAVGRPTTAILERGHAATKRHSRIFEATHRQKVMDASALRVLRQMRARMGTWHGRHLASSHPEHKPIPFKSIAGDPMPRGTKRKHPYGVAASHAACTQPEAKRRALGRCRLWMRANVHGHLASREDYTAYHRAMEDPVQRQRFDAAAAAEANGPRERLQGGSRWTASRRQLRMLRANSKRARTQWDPRAAREVVQVLIETEWHRRLERKARSKHGPQQ